MTLGNWETPDRRLMRLRTELDRTVENMGKIVTQGVETEANRRTSFVEGLQRFREVEQRQQPGRFLQRLQPVSPPTPLQLPQSREEAIAGGFNVDVGGPILEQLGEAADVPRRVVKRELIDPVVPDFRFDVPVPREAVAGIPFVGAPLLGASLVERAVSAVGGPSAPIPGKVDVPVTSGLVEEAASWVLDPFNAAFFAGPALKAAGGATRVANNIRKTGKIPAFVRAARKIAASEAGGRPPTGPLRAAEPPPTGPLRGGEGLTAPQRIHKLHNRLARDWDLERLGPEVLNPEDVAPIAKQRVIAEFGDDPTITLYRGIGPGERQPAFGTREGIGEFWSTDFNRAAGFARGGKIHRVEVSASELVNPVGTPRPVGLRATKAGDEFVLPPEITSRAVEVPSTGLLRGDVNPHIAKGDPGPPPPREPVAPGEPPREPPKGPTGPDDPEFDDILDVALKGEQPEETLVRRHQGAISTLERDAAIEVRETNQMLKDVGLGKTFRQSVVAKEEGAFDELNRLLHNPSKVNSGELIVPDELRPVYDRLRATTDFEQAARIDFDPNMALVEDYFFRGWQPPEGMFIGEARGALGRNPKFRLPRVEATYVEMIEAGFRPLFENPAEQARFSRLLGIKYREQMKLIEKIRANELARPVEGTVPEGWRIPKVGPAFEGKPYARVDQTTSARSWAVPDSLANRLENVYGKTPKLGKGEIFGRPVDFDKAVNTAVFLPKRAKLIASVFQHVDFLNRSQIGAWTGFIDALRRGDPIEGVYRLLKWPKSGTDIVRATFSPNFRNRLSKLAVDDTPLFEGRKLSNRMISGAGLSLRDETLLPNLDEVIRQVKAEPAIVKLGKAPLRLLNDLERAWRKGLFEGVYPAAILTDVKNNIAPMVVRQNPNATDAQLAGMIAKAANASYSTIPAATSVVQNQRARWFLTRFLFSLNENEGLLRAFTGAIRGENAAFFRTRLLGTYLGMMTLASTIHFASTGEMLPFDRFSPVSKDKWGPLPFGYNTDFASPNIPLTGRNATQITLDLMGQMDTAFRILNPESFLSARMSVPVRAFENQRTGTDFFGAPIDTVGPGGIFSRTSQLIQDLFAPIGGGQAGLQILRNNVQETEGLIQPGEGRLGAAGLGVQATGLNLRAERTPQLLDRVRGEVMQEMGIEQSYEEITATDSPLKNEIDNAVEERIGQELEIRQETSRLRGQITPQTEGFEAIEATRGVQETEQLASDAKLNLPEGDPNKWAGDVWRDDFRQRQRDSFRDRERIKQDFQIEFDDKEAPPESVNAAIDAYFNVNVDDYEQPDGTIDWDGFFGAQDAALKPLSGSDKKRVMEFIRKFDTPTVTEFRGAQDIMDKFFETPKYKGLSLKEGEEVDRILFDLAPGLQTRFQAQTGEVLSRRDAVRHLSPLVRDKEAREFLLEHFGGGVKAGLRRFGGTGGLRRITDVRRETDDIRNEKRDQILIDNERIMARFYPDVLERELSREQEAGLLPSSLEALFGAEMTLPDIERRGLRRLTAPR